MLDLETGGRDMGGRDMGGMWDDVGTDVVWVHVR